MKQTDIYAKCTELADTFKKLWEIEKDIKTLLKDHKEVKRIFADGEIVEVVNTFTNTGVGKAIIGMATTSIYLDPLTIKHYIDKPDLFNRDIDHIRYEVFALKNDGTLSSKHFFRSMSFHGCKIRPKQ